MPQRNILAISCLSIFCLVCYAKAPTNRHARIFERALQLVDQLYVTPQNKRELLENSLHGMMRGLDEHSAYLPPQRFQEVNEKLNQGYGGIGIHIDFDQENHILQVVRPIIDSPAFKAGILPGDIIVRINNIGTDLLTGEECVSQLKGPVGEDVRLSIERGEEAELREFTLTRAQISVLTVLGHSRNADGTWEYILDDDRRILYMQMTDFSRDTAGEMQKIFDRQDELEFEALILDLRDNGGGLLDTAVKVCDMFVTDGVIVSTRGRNGRIITQSLAQAETAISADMPIVVLINGASASASEITAGCLQDHKRAVVVGQRSYGKGSVQDIVTLEPGNKSSALKLTTASFWRPSERNIHRHPNDMEEDEWGIQPDEGFFIPYSEEEWKQYRNYRYRYRFMPASSQRPPAGIDPTEDGDPTDVTPRLDIPREFNDRQLLRAIEHLKLQLQQQPVVAL